MSGSRRRGTAERKPLSPYGYSLELEMALENLFGPKGNWRGTAAAFEDVGSVRHALQSAIKRIRKRGRELAYYDDRLQMLLDLDLDGLERASRRLGKYAGSELDVISRFLGLVAHLLGYDWLEGNPNRSVIYYQTAAQQKKDDTLRHPPRTEGDVSLVWKKKYEVVKHLYASGLRAAQISEIMNLPIVVVKNILVRAEAVSRDDNLYKR